MLIDRLAASSSRRVAIMGLTRGAGKTTALVHLIRAFKERGTSAAIAAAGREEEDVEFTQAPRGLTLPVAEGTIVATSTVAAARATARLEILESTTIPSPQGPVIIARSSAEGDVEPVGPSSAHELRQVIETLGRHTEGPTLIEGSFNRRSFAAPGIADGLVLAVGAALAPEIERVVAVARYYLDLFGMEPCDARAAEVFPAAESEGAAVLLAKDGRIVGGVPWRGGASARLLITLEHPQFTRLVLPSSVGDDFVIPLLRDRVRFQMIVRDPMRIALSPVYYSAWKKLGGGIRVVHPTRVLALALNPTNPSGPDQPPEEFLRAFREGIPEVPSHDVIQEDPANQPKRRWFSIGALGGE
jgi:hypothetical protein